MKSQNFEYDVDVVLNDLVCGLNSIANKVEDGSREEIAYVIRQLAGKICEHWPTCLFEADPDNQEDPDDKEDPEDKEDPDDKGK